MLNTFFNSVSSVTVILLMAAAGYFFGKKKWILAENKPFLEKYLMNFAIPCMCMDGFVNNLTQELIMSSWRIIIVCFSGFCLSTLSAAAIALLLRLPKKRAGVFVGMGGFSNALFVGYPMCRELFGDGSLVYVMLFFLSNSILIYVLCYTAFTYFSETKTKIGSKQLRRIFINPPVLGAVAGIFAVMFGITLPRPIGSFIGYITNTVSPLALFYCGFIIYETGIKNIRFDRGMAALPVMRFVIAPLICAAMCRILNVNPPASSVLIIEMSMPVVTIMVVMAKEWDADVQYAAIGIVLTTIACFVTVPVIMLFL